MSDTAQLFAEKKFIEIKQRLSQKQPLQGRSAECFARPKKALIRRNGAGFSHGRCAS
jgi:hypothetical protein